MNEQTDEGMHTAGPVEREVRPLPQYEVVREGKTYRVQKDLGNGKIRCVMRPGVGEFKSRHQRVYMTRKGAQEIADALNARDAAKAA